LLSCVGCSGSLPWLRGDLANHPTALVGNWVDVEKSTPRDSSIWMLAPNGDDRGLHIARDGVNDPSPHVRRDHYGYWYVRRNDAGEQELCVTRRPSRDAPSCTVFVMSTDSTTSPPRRMLRLAAYTGAHHTGERVLIEWR
jgi:hypothetical protein